MSAAELIGTIILACILMIIGVLVGTAIVMPFQGALVRLRANYNPKGVGLESGLDSRVGPTLNTLWGTLTRTKRIEGWNGLYKGAIPNIIFSGIVSVASIVFVGASATRGPKGSYSVPEAGGIRMALFTVFMTLVTLPMTVIINRCIITPYALPLNARQSLRLILTPDEYTKPWTLYFAPGLLAVSGLHVFWVTVISRSIKYMLVGTMPDGAIDHPGLFILFLIFQFASAFLLTPLEVITTRLSIQRNSESPYSLSSQNDGGALPDGVTYAGADEDVIGLRPETEPYAGTWDAMVTIAQEEGREALFRAWWVTAIGLLGNAFS
ncbi:hypothetical protein QFC20_004464 [Naganishia adeliensis]|uniref:Uncharacterized protein n=1 Tax=Naganishia adeliensis TaxID=92952 RepID=A0ACC2VZC4_9TREE|nr:hypothetical protein QFC20_004464 [Naganishia adeliensis]